MIEAGLQFPSDARGKVVATFLSLPTPLRPTHRAAGEDDVGARIRDVDALVAKTAQEKTGFFLKNDQVTYSIRLAGDQPLLCDCFMDESPDLAKDFLRHMASADPEFGFACRKAEREARNQIVTRLGENHITSWVGRDPEKYVPSLYWLTLIPDRLAQRHDVAIDALAEKAVSHETLANGQHLLQFYANPDEWKSSGVTAALIAATPGIFDVEKVRPQAAGAANFLALNAIVRGWK